MRITARGEWYALGESEFFYVNTKGVWGVRTEGRFCAQRIPALPKDAEHMLMTNGGIWPILGARIDKGQYD